MLQKTNLLPPMKNSFATVLHEISTTTFGTKIRPKG
jgi:hypothetical protein